MVNSSVDFLSGKACRLVDRNNSPEFDQEKAEGFAYLIQKN